MLKKNHGKMKIIRIEYRCKWCGTTMTVNNDQEKPQVFYCPKCITHKKIYKRKMEIVN